MGRQILTPPQRRGKLPGTGAVVIRAYCFEGSPSQTHGRDARAASASCPCSEELRFKTKGPTAFAGVRGFQLTPKKKLRRTQCARRSNKTEKECTRLALTLLPTADQSQAGQPCTEEQSSRATIWYCGVARGERERAASLVSRE